MVSCYVPLHLSVTQCPSLLASHYPTRFSIIVIIYSGHRRRQPWLYVSIKLLKIYVSKIVLNVLFIVEVFENKSCILYLEQHELTTGTNVPIFIHCSCPEFIQKASEKSKYILMVLLSRIMSSI